MLFASSIARSSPICTCNLPIHLCFYGGGNTCFLKRGKWFSSSSAFKSVSSKYQLDNWCGMMWGNLDGIEVGNLFSGDAERRVATVRIVIHPVPVSFVVTTQNIYQTLPAQDWEGSKRKGDFGEKEKKQDAAHLFSITTVFLASYNKELKPQQLRARWCTSLNLIRGRHIRLQIYLPTD